MPTPPVDLRKHAQQTKKRLIFAGLGLILLIGTILIAVTYGTPAAACGLSVFLIALVPVALITLVLAILQWAANRWQRHDSDDE